MKRFVTEQSIQTVILTSGTLSPMDSFAAELALPFPIRLENDHVVHQSQVSCLPCNRHVLLDMLSVMRLSCVVCRLAHLGQYWIRLTNAEIIQST